MDKLNFASMIVKYWYLLEFLGQTNFPVQSKGERERCIEAAQGCCRSKRITLYHVLDSSRNSRRGDHGINSMDLSAALQDDTNNYSQYGVLSDEIHICLGKIKRNILAECLQQVFHHDLELPEKDEKQICLIGLKCDEHGRYIMGSINVSPLVWGIHCLLAHSRKLTKENMADFLSIEMYKSDMQSLDDQLVEDTGEEWETAYFISS